MYSSIAANKRNTVIIMAVFIGLIGAVGWAVGYMHNDIAISYGIIAVAAVYAIIQYFMASRLAVMTTGAKEIQKRDNPRLYRVVENLAITSGMPMPKVYIINDPAPNAFATGRDPRHAMVGATSGLLDIMDDRELEAVMAHEMSHVRNYDIRVSMIAFGLVSAISLLSELALRTLFYGGSRRSNNNGNIIILIVGIVLVILAPIIAMLIQFAISRQREYLADASGSLLTRDPEGMANALKKLGQYSQPMQRQSGSTAHMFLVNPLKKGFLAGLFSTHPALESRIERLMGSRDKF